SLQIRALLLFHGRRDSGWLLAPSADHHWPNIWMTVLGERDKPCKFPRRSPRKDFPELRLEIGHHVRRNSGDDLELHGRLRAKLLVQLNKPPKIDRAIAQRQPLHGRAPRVFENSGVADVGRHHIRAQSLEREQWVLHRPERIPG